MAETVQADRPLRVRTTLGEDILLLTGFDGTEGLSQLFNFQLDTLSDNRNFFLMHDLLGQPVSVDLLLANGKTRFFSGICNRVTEGARDKFFTAFRLEIVPSFWLLTKRVQSRIFQHVSVPDILKEVLNGLKVTFKLGKYEPRDYCAQYRESDFTFASRLMEEEGIYYYFTHGEKEHEMIVADTPQGHLDLPNAGDLVFEEVEGGTREEDRVFVWRVAQELRSGKVTLWDHNFELPGQHLDAEKAILEQTSSGLVIHKQKIGNNDKLELYDFPGGYANRFDGIDKGGGEQPDELKKIFQDNVRTANLRMQEEAVAGLVIGGESTVRQLVSGHRFRLTNHFHANGRYVLTRVSHHAKATGDFRSGEIDEFTYDNKFSCVPDTQPFRPPRVTPKAVMGGAQTATVVGPPGQEIFTDKYGRVKVQFHWDRQGKNDADSSCWVRVGQFWAGKRYGAFFWPRVGNEVIVDFLEGDPDNPIVVGSVYNADQMPPNAMPGAQMVNGIRTNSTPGGGGFNSLVFDDTKGKEQITIHGQHDMSTTVEHNETQTVKNNRTSTVHGSHTETVTGDTKISISKGNYNHTVATGTATYHVEGHLVETYKAGQETFVNGGIYISCVDEVVQIYSATEVVLVAGENAAALSLKSNGTITMHGKLIVINADEEMVTDAPTTSIGGNNITVNGDMEVTVFTGDQSVKTSKTAVEVSGAKIASSAVGNHEITGTLVKIN